MSPLLLGLALAEPVDLTLVASVRDGIENDAYVRALEAFEATHPDVDVHLVSVQWQGWDAHDAFLRFGALEDPHVDVLLLDTPWVPEMARPGWLLPLDEAIDTDPFVATAVSGGRYDGHLYGVPLSLKGNALFYRTDLLAAAGLEPPRTLDELSAAAEVLAPRVDVPIALHHDYLYNDLLPFLGAAGGGFERDGRPILDDPVNVAVMERIQSWFQDPPQLAAPERWAQTRGAYTTGERWFGEGRVAFLVSWSTRWKLAQLPGSPVAGKVGVTAIPGLREGAGASNLGSWYLAVSGASRHPELATELVRFLSSEPQQRAFLDELGEIPSRRALLDDEALAEAYPALRAFREILPRAVLRPRVGSERAVSTAIEEAMHAIVGGAPVAESLAAAQRRVESRWDGPLPPAPPEPVWEGPPPANAPSSLLPLGLALGAGALVVLGLMGLLQVAARQRWTWLESLRPRMMLMGGVAVLCIALLQGALAASLTLHQQAAELASQHRALRDALEAQALGTGKDLSLAASLVYDAGDMAPLEQLLLASHFTEGLVGLQWLDLDGNVLLDGQQALFGGGSPTPVAAGIAERVVRARVQVRALDGEPPVVEVLAPVISGGVHVGSLRALLSQEAYLRAVSATEDRHQVARRTQLLTNAVTTTGVMVLGMLFIVWLSKRLTEPIVELTGHAARIRAGDLQVRIESRSRDEVGQLANTMAGMVEGLRDRDFVRDTFGRYLTPALAQQLLSDPDALALGGTVQRVTILMSDLRGFTSLSERLGPEGTVQVLNRYLGRMTEVIVEEGGTIDEFLGDAILVLFGAPISAEDDAFRAVRCALRMQEAMAGFNADSATRGLPELEMGVGLCTGDVVAGNIGSEQRAKYGVVGDPVNTAARVEGLTVGGQILVAASTATAVGEGLEVAGPYEVAVKGKAEPMAVYEVRALAGLKAPTTAAEAWVAHEEEVELERLLGKQLGAEPDAARIVAVAGRRLKVATEAEVPVFGDVRLLGREGGYVYGKVVAVEEGGLVVQLTGGDPEVRARWAEVGRAMG